MLALGSYIGYYHCHGLVRIGPAKVDVSQHTAYDMTQLKLLEKEAKYSACLVKSVGPKFLPGGYLLGGQ